MPQQPAAQEPMHDTDARVDHLPEPAAHNPQRLQLRPYDSDWAWLPAHEVNRRTEPGTGPHGTVGTSGTNPAMVLLFLAFAVLIATFFAPYLPVLLAGLGLLVVSILVFALRERYVGTMHGVGTLKPKHRPEPPDDED